MAHAAAVAGIQCFAGCSRCQHGWIAHGKGTAHGGCSSIVGIAGLIGSLAPVATNPGGLYFGLDFFVLNVVLTGLLFVPLERMFPLKREQRLFRGEWREDLFYYFVSSMMVQVLTFLAMAPAQTIVAATAWQNFRAGVGSQPVILQVVEIMFFTDLFPQM